MLLKCVIQAEYYDGVNKEDTPEQYLFSRNVIYMNVMIDMMENKIFANNGSSIVLYTTDDGNTQLEVKFEKDTVWLTQSQIAELFGRYRTVITRHIRNIFKEGGLDENITCAKFAHKGTDQDQTYETNSAHQGQGACPCWVSSVPTWGKHRARFPKIYCACPWLIFLFSAN